MELQEQEGLRFANELEKLRLLAEIGDLSFEGSLEISADEEAELLKQLRLFEENMRDNCPQKIKDILGNPGFPDPAELNDEAIYCALRQLLSQLEEKRLAFSWNAEKVSEGEVYRFLSTEFMEYKTMYLALPGMKTVFRYEDFHP